MVGSSPAQNPFLAEVNPVYDSGTATWGPFPALLDMRSAWGDVDGDGDLDVVLMGRGPTGPVTKLFLNNPSGIVHPFAFSEATVSPALPQLQDGALAWGDMDNDGDLDLAITGSTVSAPSSVADLRAYVLRNEGVDAFGTWSTSPSSIPEPCYGGCVSWGDMDSDGDRDLFLSGIGGPNLWPVAVVFENIHGNLIKLPAARFLSDAALHSLFTGDKTIEEILLTPLESDTNETRRAEWTDVNKDGLVDLILLSEEWTYFESSGRATTQQVWINQGIGSGSRFQRLGDTTETFANNIVEIPPFWLAISAKPPAWTPAALESLYLTRVCGGVGDWDGDGWTDLAFIGPCDAAQFGSPVAQSLAGWSLRREPVAVFPNFLIPGFSTHVPVASQALTTVTGQTSADILNSGRQQWLGSVITDYGAMFLQLLDGDQTGNLLEPFGVYVGNVESRSGGVLDAIDVDNDGRLDILHSGYDESSDVATVFFANSRPAPNTPPAAPGGLAAEAGANRVHFHWNQATDAQTPAAALRYALWLKHSNGIRYIVADARSDGKRLRQDLQGTLQTTDFTFDAYNAGLGLSLPDGTYTWSVQSVDSGGLGSSFAPVQTFILGDPNAPPPPLDSGERIADVPWRDTAIDLGDVDSDGDLDVVLAGKAVNTSGLTVIRKNDGAHPTLPDTWAFSAGQDLPSIEFGAVKWGDVDGDGDLDLAVTGRSSSQPFTGIYGNNGGTLTLQNPPLDGLEYSALDWGDFDNDGDLDLIVTGYRDNVPHTQLYRNGGDLNQVPGTLIPQPSNLPDIGLGAAAWGDYDNDGDLDLLLCGNTAAINAPPVPCTLPPGPHSPGTSFLCANLNGATPQISTTLFRNDGPAAAGHWQFTPTLTDLPPIFSYSGGRAIIARAEWCDMDGDGLPDLILGGMATVAGNPLFGTPSARVYRNAGPGFGLGEWAFVPGQELLDGIFDHALQTLTCADWSRDGWPDILIGGWLNGPGAVPTQVFMGNGGNYYTPQIIKTTLAPDDFRFASGLAAFGHFDGDDNVDIIQSGRWGIQGSGGLGDYGTAGRVFLAPPLTANIPPAPPFNLAASVSPSGAEVTFSWDPSADGIHVLKPTYNLHVERVDGQPGGMPGMADLTTGKRLVSRRGNVAQHRIWTLRNLPAGTYRWAVQGIDASLAASTFASAAQTFTMGPPVPPVIQPPPPWHVWVVGNPLPSAIEHLSLAAGRRARLIAGRRGQLLLSRNREPFARVDSGVFTDLHDVIIDSEGAIAVGEAGTIRITSDGIIWTESPSGTTATLRAVARGDSGWLVGGDDVLLHSTNRLAWTSVSIPAGIVIYDLIWAQGRYVLTGDVAKSKILLTSTDGLAWTDVTPPGLDPGTLTGVASDGAKFIVVGGNDSFGPGPLTVHQDILTSANGLAWSVVTNPFQDPMTQIIRGGTAWLAVTYREVRRSLDGVVWNTVLGNSFSHMNTIAADDGLITMAGAAGIVFDTPEAGLSTESWTQRAGADPVLANYALPVAIAVSGDTVVVVGSYSWNYVSQDGGRTWQGSPFGNSNGYYGIASGAGRFVRTKSTGIEHSADGLTWQSVTLPDVRSIVFGGDRFVAAKNAGGFLYSTNGTIWTAAGPANLQADSLAWGLGHFLALERYNGNVHSSPDGITWTQVSQVFAINLCFAKDRFFALSYGQTKSSPDGVTWTIVPGLPSGIALTQVIWHQNLFFAVTSDARLFTSPDALTWTSIPLPASGSLKSIAAVNGGIVVIGSGHTILFAPDPSAASIPAPPPFLTVSAGPSLGFVSLTLTGRQGQMVFLERSDDLAQWTDVQSFTLSGGAVVLQVPAPIPPTAGFFRLRWQP